MSLVAALVPIVLVVGGSNPTPYEAGPVSPPYLGGVYGPESYVPYPASLGPPFEGTTPLDQSVAAGVQSAESMQNATSQPVVFMGTSQGSLVLDQVMRDDVAAGVPASKVSFVVIENPEGDRGALTLAGHAGIEFQGYKAKPVPETPYNVTVVVREDDGVADLPNVPTSPGYMLAMVNAFMGGMYLHSTAQFSDLSKVPASNITTSVNSLGGRTTTYLVPTPTLPLLRPLVQLGVPSFIVAGLNGLLKPLVNSAYNRGTTSSTPAASSAVTATAAKPKPVAAVKPHPMSSSGDTKQKSPNHDTKPHTQHHQGHKK